MPNATLTSKGQITIPREIRDLLGVNAGDRLSFEVREGGEVVVQSETTDIRSLQGILKRKGTPVSLARMDEAIQRGASRR